MDGKGEMPTAAALALARASRRVALKHQDLSLLRASKDLKERALSAVKKRQSVLSNYTLHPAKQSERSPKAPAGAPTPAEMDEMCSQKMLQFLAGLASRARGESPATES
jgi:hypothetical protein